MHCYTSVEALIDHADKGIDNDTQVSMIALFDHEEVGSDSAAGAGSPIMYDSVSRICACFAGTNTPPRRICPDHVCDSVSRI